MPSRAAAEQVADLIGPICKLFEKDAIGSAEVAIGAMALWALDCIENGRLRADAADEAFTLLVVYLGDHPELPALSEDAQELLFEGQHLHHWREAVGADPSIMRQLADRIVARADDSIERARTRAPGH